MRALLLAVALLGAVLPAAAREFKVATVGRQLTMELAGHVVSVPGPVWSPPEAAAEIQKSQIVFRELEPGVESVEFLAVDESVVNWTRMMGVLAVERPGYVSAFQVASIVEPMRRDCTPTQTVISRLPALSERGLDGLLLMCGRYRPTGEAPSGCVGGVLVAVVLQSSKGAMKAYHEWCTGGFDVRDATTWPVSADILSRHAVDLQRATSFLPIELATPPRGAGLPATGRN